MRLSVRIPFTLALIIRTLVQVPVLLLYCQLVQVRSATSTLDNDVAKQWYVSAPILSLTQTCALTRNIVRATPQGYFYSGILIGPAVAPALAGILTEYVDSPRPDYGWRAMQWLLFAMGVSASALCFFCFPETIHERGIDARRREEAEARRREAEKSGEIVQSDSGEEVDGKATVAMRWWDLRRWEVIWLNPLEPLKLLLLPHILLMVSCDRGETEALPLILFLLPTEPDELLCSDEHVHGVSPDAFRRPLDPLDDPSRATP